MLQPGHCARENITTIDVKASPINEKTGKGTITDRESFDHSWNKLQPATEQAAGRGDDPHGGFAPHVLRR